MIVYINSQKKYLGHILSQIKGLESVFISYQKQSLSIEIHDLDEEYTICYRNRSVSIKKPILIDDLITNLMAMLKDCFYEIEGKFFYPWRRYIIEGDKIVNLTEKESHLLYFLLLNKDGPIAKKNILKSIWGYSEESETSTLEAHVFRLRNKLAILKITDFIITFESGYMVKNSL